MFYLAWLLQEGGGGASVITVIIVLLLAIVGIFAWWTIFEKAGKPGWAVLVPIYNAIVFLEIVGRPAWWIILFFIPVVNFIVTILIMNDLSKSFGKGTGFTVGLLLLQPIFVLILAFGDAMYIGPGGESAAPAPPAQPAM